MNKLLLITCNPKSVVDSRGRQVANEFITHYRKNNPQDEITEINLFDHDIPRIDYDVLEAGKQLRLTRDFNSLNQEQQEKLSRINASAEHFSSHDKYVFVTPMWNLGFPAELKMYIDSVCVAGKTFTYTEKGPIGLLYGQEKKCLSIHSTGGFHYGKVEDHSVPFLKSITHFMGIEEFTQIIIEGVDALPAKADEFISSAMQQARQLAASF